MDCDKRKSAEDPPCSAEILKEMLILIVKALEEAQVNYWVSYGTLLGAVRNQTIIPWTADIDFVIKGEEYKNLGNIFAK
jgi:lipopolysaccharide cholinephosphotransferase